MACMAAIRKISWEVVRTYQLILLVLARSATSCFACAIRSAMPVPHEQSLADERSEKPINERIDFSHLRKTTEGAWPKNANLRYFFFSPIGASWL
jgi:hypothetical protein